MKTLIFLLGVATFAFSPQAAATQVGTSRVAGAGFSIGEPTGIVGKLFIGQENAIDAGISLYRAYGYCQDNGRNKFDRCSGGSSLGLNVDYLWQYNLLAGAFRLDWHIGAGGRVWIWSSDRNSGDFALAARMPVGLDFMPPKPDILEVFLELTPTFYVAPGTALDVEGAIGVRFYF